MRIIGHSSELGDQGIRKEALEGFWKKWNKPSSPASPATPATPSEPAPAVQDAYSQYAMQYGADFQQRLEAIAPWSQQTLQLINALSQQMQAGMKMEFPKGNPLVNRDGMEYLNNLTADVNTWMTFAARELKRLETLKAPPAPYPWDDEAIALMVRLKEVSKRNWAQISGELHKLRGVPVTAEQVAAKYKEAKTSSTPATSETSGTTEPAPSAAESGMGDLGASIPASVGMRRTAEAEPPASESFEDQLKAGIEIEKEHAPTVEKIVKDIQDGKLDMDTEKIAELIARDHLGELPDYYSRLIKMEEQAKS
jgi:anti-sigma28 factor (negative regulator of flagellin synthesis)